MITRIVTGTNPNDSTGDKLREAFIKVNNNYDEIEAEFGTKAPLTHTHSISEVTGLQQALNTLQTGIDSNVSALNEKAGLDVYDAINSLNTLIDNFNTVITQQNTTIIALTQKVNALIECTGCSTTG